jgi:hypothetical protein
MVRVELEVSVFGLLCACVNRAALCYSQRLRVSRSVFAYARKTREVNGHARIASPVSTTGAGMGAWPGPVLRTGQPSLTGPAGSAKIVSINAKSDKNMVVVDLLYKERGVRAVYEHRLWYWRYYAVWPTTCVHCRHGRAIW